MFNYNWKIVIRNLWKYKSYTIINILGMGIGIAAMVWGFQTYRFSFSFDNFHKNTADVYRVLIHKKDADGLKGIVPLPVAQMARSEFSGITEMARYDYRWMNMKYDTNEVFSEQVNFTDPVFFKIFTFPVVAGTNDISDPNSVLITEKIAKKYFGSENPIGKTLQLYAGETYARPLTVKGVLKDPPMNSTMQFNIVTGFNNQLSLGGTRIKPDDWSLFLGAVFFRIPNARDVARIEKGLDQYIPIQNKAREDAKVSAFKLITLRQNAEWVDMVDSNALYQRPGDAATFGPFVLAFLIFLSACLNFSNTTVARANRRLKEIGMRKVMGSTYGQLISQLLIECSVIVLLAILVSALLNSFWLPLFNSMFNGIKIGADYLHDINLLGFMACMLIGATLLAGSYPALYLSRFSPTSIFRGSVKFGGSNLFSRLMLGLQLTIALVTVIAGIAFARNSAFQQAYDYGYAIESTVGTFLNDSSTYQALKNELSSVAGITSVAGTHNHIGFGSDEVSAEFGGNKKQVDLLEVGRGYPETMQLKIVAGRSFDAGMETDFTNGLLITEKMASLYNWTAAQALGKSIRINDVDYSVVGVIKNFNATDLFRTTEPLAMKLVKETKYQILVISAKPGDLTTAYSKMRDAWKKINPNKSFSGFYQNEIKEEAYRVTNSVATIFTWFAIVSILLTATGLYALVSLTVLKKMKEIALRKVVGAGDRQIVVLVNKGYFWIFIIAVLIGCYGGWALTQLLLDLIFKINVGVEISSMIWSVLVLFLIAAISSGIKVWQAVRTNPVKLLRAE